MTSFQRFRLNLIHLGTICELLKCINSKNNTFNTSSVRWNIFKKIIRCVHVGLDLFE